MAKLQMRRVLRRPLRFQGKLLRFVALRAHGCSRRPRGLAGARLYRPRRVKLLLHQLFFFFQPVELGGGLINRRLLLLIA